LEGTAASEGSTSFFSIVGGRSVVECLPVVHGGMERNSSNVRTRGLQHFQPGEKVSKSYYTCEKISILGSWSTFLSFVKDWGAGVIVTFLLGVCVHLPTRLVNTFLRHLELTVTGKGVGKVGFAKKQLRDPKG
jgi:hypothetical protein